MSKISADYKTNPEGTVVNVVISCPEPLNVQDIMNAFGSIVRDLLEAQTESPDGQAN